MTVRFARIASLLAVGAVVAVAAASSSAATSAPTGLHGFLLRADEPDSDSFHRSPSFAWDPFPGAVRYQFQLSTSSTFRENAIFYNTNTVITPVAAPSLVLPWVTGSPHALYARVRGITSDGDTTPWSDDYGFDLVAPAPPKPMAQTDPGLLRWTPSEGATAYQVWLIDTQKKGSAPGTGKELVHTNVLDEREFYTFHPTQKWMGTVRWRVRAQRSIEAGKPSNGLPTTSWGAWSPIYSSTNPPVAGGPIKLLHTISDVVSGDDSSPAHRLMTGFTWTGNQTLSGATAELYRVYAFTDKQCLNNVFTSAVVGSPAYAPRPFGPLALPQDSSGIAGARGKYLDDGSEPQSEMYDGTQVTASESAAAATPTTTAPADLGPDLPTAGGTTSGSTAAPTGGVASTPVSAGAPVDLWDTDNWPKSGYYWVVVGVGAVSVSAGASTVAAPGASQGSTLVPVSDVTQFQIGQSITIGVAPNSDTSTVGAIGNGIITLSSPLNFGHAVGSAIASTASGSIVYRDLELPQEVCAKELASPSLDRVQRFGISSEPSLTTAQEPFATGLSPTGRLVSAARPTTFYGQPLVSWTPSLAADTYQVQWSKKAYPFKPEGSIMTPATASVLPLTPGTWYYRVRGFDYNLPSNAQMLSWSDVEQLDVAKPQFKILPSTTPKKKFKILP
jgi:hypothetical protein